MKKHKIAFVISLLAFPLIVCSLFLSMGLMLKNKSWKPANKVFPIFGKYENGNHFKPAPPVRFTCDSLCIENETFWPYNETANGLAASELLVDTTQIKVHYNAAAKSLALRCNNSGLNINTNQIPKIKLVNCNYYFNSNQFIQSKSAQWYLSKSQLSWTRDLKTKSNQSSTEISTAKEIYFNLSDSSELELKNLIPEIKYNIVLQNGSKLEIENEQNLPNLNLNIYYDESCTIAVPTNLLKYTKQFLKN